MNCRNLTFFVLAILASYGLLLVTLVLFLGIFDPAFTLGNLIQAASTLGAGLLVAKYVQKENQIQFNQKQLLVSQLQVMSEKLIEFHGFKSGGPLVEIAAALKQLAMRAGAISAAADELGFNASIKNRISFTEELSELRRIATQTESLKKMEAVVDECPAVVRDGILVLASERASQLESHLEKMQIKVFKAQIAVNAS